MFRVLFFGDIVGKTGRAAVRQVLPALKKKHKPALVVANGENAAHGIGLTAKIARELFDSGIDFLTGGNHMFDKAEQIAEVFSNFPDKVVRPANFEGDYPGKGFAQLTVKDTEILIINLNAQVFMERQFDGLIGSPFKKLDEILQTAPKSDIILVDFHSEATSEKRGLGFYADGRVAALLGTHTHVQTADAQVLPGGTAYISDAGMCGASQSILGVKKETALKRFLSAEKVSLEVEETDEAEMGYIVIDVDERTGKARSIKAFLETIILK
ncbi:MAG: TIGR00282 family metallophosphoesterase [Patescibacteria group bacterium]|nr:TIGR00282 family metallophosphoesterase [Patescibacteria group bacterium]